MNEKLVEFIELCLVDGVISDKEREVIFRKSKELGIPEDECEIIVEGLSSKFLNNKENVKSNNIEIKQVKVDSKLEEKILSLNNNVLKQFENILINFNKRLKFLDENPDLRNKSFIDWLKKLKGRLVKKDGIFTGTTVVKVVNFNNILKTGEEKIIDFTLTKTDFKVEGKDVIGIFKTFSKVEYILTEDFYVQETSIPITNFWGTTTGYKKTYENKKKLDDINISDKETSVIFQQLLRTYLKEINENHFNDLLENISFNDEEKKIITILENVDSKNSEIVYKVTSEIKNLVTDLNNYFYTLGKPIEEVFISQNLFTPYIIPSGINKEYSINKSFFQQLDIIIHKVKFISGLITLRNDLLLSVLNFDNNRVNYLKVKLDDLGVLMDFYQKKSLSKMDEQIKILQNGFNVLSELMTDIIYKFDIVEKRIQDTNEKIKDLNENISFGNLLSIIQSYQLYKINKNTKSLRG